MSGTKEGGIKTREVLRNKDPEFYKKLGHTGGTAPHVGKRGFAKDDRSFVDKLIHKPSRAKRLGRLGGEASKRRKAVHGE